jgi:hypothetical protein
MTRAGIAAAVLLALTPAAVGAAGGRGFAELRLHGYSGVEGQPVQTIQRLRPELSTDLSDRISLTVGVELGLSQGRSFENEWQETLRASALGPMLEAAQCTWPEEENSFLRVSRAEDYLAVERLYLDWYLPKADLRLGRQAVHWGSALVVNPTDPFPEILVLQPWRQRRGVNALRATIPIGEDHDVQMVLGGNDALDAARVAVRGTLNVGLADISLVGAYRQESESGIVGLDLRGTAVVGYWLEGSAHFGHDNEWFEEVAVGIDYSWPVLDGLLVRAQYYRNGAGQTHVPALAPLSDAIEMPMCATGDVPIGGDGRAETADPFAPFLRGRDYAMLMLAQTIDADLTFSAVAIQNLGDGSAVVVPTLSWAATDRLEFAATAQLPFTTWGRGGELHPADEDLVLTVPAPGGPIPVDMRGLVPSATFIVWSRLNF